LRDPREGEILSPLQAEEVRGMTGDSPQVSDRNGPVGEPEPVVRGGGLPLPGLKYWRMRKGISQAELARRADLSSDYLFKVESGRRACRPDAAELLADLLGVGLEVLRRKPGATFDMETPPSPTAPKSPTGTCTRPT
jgi:hypothetical protein